MKIAGLYDALSTHYNKSCSYGIINSAQSKALKQLQKHIPGTAEIDILDVGVGAGDFFQKLKPDYPNANLFGLDLSEKMLKIAQQKVEFEGVIGSLQNLDQYFQNSSKDVVAAHFISAYVNMGEIFKKCSEVLRPGGYLTLLTTTFESFKHLQADIELMGKKYDPISQFIYTMVNKGLRKTHCPRDLKEIEQYAVKQELKIVESLELKTKVAFADEEEALQFVFNDGWGVNIADVPFIPFKVARFLTLIFLKRFTYPFEDEAVVDVVLLQK